MRPAKRLFDAARVVAERAAIPLDQVMLVGLKDDTEPKGPGLPSSTAARLVELTGCTVVSGFAERDVAAGGHGRPLAPLVDWLLANDNRFSRLVVHLDGSVALTVLPRAAGPAGVRSFEAGPGTALLQSLTAALMRDAKQLDSRGVLAVQGRQIKPLVRRWASHPFLRHEPPKFLADSDFARPFIDETIQLTLERGWSVVDVLCTATHFVAACPADAVRQFLAKDCRIDQVAFVGRGTQNGFLLRLLEEQFSALGAATISLPRIVPEAYEAITASVLACLAIDGIPSNLPSITGATGPRRLGHIVPGSPHNWRQCVEWMHHASKPLSARAA